MKTPVLLAALALTTLGIWSLTAHAGSAMKMGCCAGTPAATTTTAPSTQPTTQKAVYVCPMDADVVSDKPGKCPKCGMDLVQK